MVCIKFQEIFTNAMDRLTRKERSNLMSKVRGKNTKIEVMVRNALRNKGIRSYRVNYGIKGTPDLVFVKEKIAVFIDGCFWHKCRLCYSEPKSNVAYWKKKVAENVNRDRNVDAELIRQGWDVIRIWEHDVKKNLAGAIKKILRELEYARLQGTDQISL